MPIDPKLIDKLLSTYRGKDVREILSERGVLGEFTQAIVAKCLPEPHPEYVEIGERKYNVSICPIYRLPEYQKILRAWQRLGYEKHSSKRHQAEWSLLHALMLSKRDEWISYTGSHTSYPSLPHDVDLAREMLQLATYSRKVVRDFTPPEEQETESKRIYSAKVGTKLEKRKSSLEDVSN